MSEIQRFVLLPGVFLVRRRWRYLARVYLNAVSPLVIWLHPS